jgi:diacylglycerol kinase
MEKFSLRKRAKSFTHAFNGFKILLKDEHNAWIHLIITLFVIVFGFLFHISKWEWIAIIACIGMVFAFELINSAMENMADFVSPQKHELIRKAKDLSAAAVLITAITSFVIGLIIFIPKIISLLKVMPKVWGVKLI